jgi:hypothetical protein
VKIPERDTAVFSTSAIDLFASALGAFILLVMLLFPYYQNAGRDEAYSRSEAIMNLRRMALGEVDRSRLDADQMQAELSRLSEANQTTAEIIKELGQQLTRGKEQLAEIRVDWPDPLRQLDPEPRILSVSDGVEFSILGLATEARSFVILIDMSGSMMNFSDLMLRSILDILEPLDERNEFAFVGFHGNPMPVLWRFPGDGSMLKASAENLKTAREYARSLSRKFVGTTPTHYALQAALDYPASAIILMSDGEPNTPPGYIIRDITSLNQFRQTEIHSVAIGDYTHNRNLVLFMQTLARLNNGDFVGVSR